MIWDAIAPIMTSSYCEETVPSFRINRVLKWACDSPFNFSQEFSRISPYWFLDFTAAGKYNYMADSRLVQRQLGTPLQGDALSHWPGGNLKSFSCSSRIGNWKSSDDKNYWNYRPMCVCLVCIARFWLHSLYNYSPYAPPTGINFVYAPRKRQTRL